MNWCGLYEEGRLVDIKHAEPYRAPSIHDFDWPLAPDCVYEVWFVTIKPVYNTTIEEQNEKD